MYKKNTVSLKSTIKTYSPSVWRLSYLIKSNPVHHSTEKKLWSKNSFIPSTFKNYEIIVYSGKKWFTRRINTWNIGFRAGEFVWTRKVATYKAKKVKKK